MSTFDLCYSHKKRRWRWWLNGNVLVECFFARDFGQKLNFMVRHSKMITFYDPKWTRPKDIFLTRLHVAVFYESGTDRKRTVPPIDPCYSRQKRRHGDHRTGGTSYPLWRRMESRDKVTADRDGCEVLTCGSLSVPLSQNMASVVYCSQFVQWYLLV